MSAKTERYIDSLTSKGRISFTLEDLCRELTISRNAGLTALARLKKQRKITSLSKGYYFIVTPEFRERGCMPADFLIDDLMQHLNVDYYVCLLSAALYHGAAHQQPQMLQVMLPDKRRDIQAGQIAIEFIQNINHDQTPWEKFNTRSGYIKVSTPEGTAMDMMRYMKQSGGLNRVVTVLDELAEKIDHQALINLAQGTKEFVWIHRLGFIFEKLGKIHLSESIYTMANKQYVGMIPLVPYDPIKGMPRDQKWRIAINATIESDL